MEGLSKCHNATISNGRDGKPKCDVCGNPVESTQPGTNTNMAEEEQKAPEQSGDTGASAEQNTSGEGSGTQEAQGSGEGSGEGSGTGEGGESGTGEGTGDSAQQ